MNGAAAHLVMELEEKLVELEGLQGKQDTCGDTENTFKDRIQNHRAPDLLGEDRERAPAAQVQLKKDPQVSTNLPGKHQNKRNSNTHRVFHWSCE